MRTRSTAVLGLLAVLAFPAGAMAQGVRVGPVVGLNSATWGGDDAEGVDSRVAWLIGGFVNFDLSRSFGLQPELLYSRKGAKFDFEGLEEEVTVATAYLQIPVLGQLRFPGQSVTPYFLLGPALGFRVGCEAQAEAEGVEVSVDCEDIDINLSDSDFSLIGGVGLEFRNFTVSLRYDYGFTKLGEDQDEEVYNRTITLAVGYAFRLGT